MSETDRVRSPFETLCQQVSALTEAVQKLQDGYVQVDGRLQQLAAHPSPSVSATAPVSGAAAPQAAASPPVVMTHPEPRVPTPERFSGDRRKYRSFKNACSLYLALQPRTFFSEAVKVGFVISLLSEEPQAWAHGLMEQRSPVLDSLDTFFEQMARLYDDPQRTATAETILHNLGQGRRPVEDYTAEFRKWSADTGWNEAALKYQFRQGLSEALKDELARTETPATLEDLIQAATQLDRRLRERRAERLQTSRPTWTPPRPAPMHPPLPAPSSNSVPDPEPMQLGLVRSPLTSEERQRRRLANLCLYCGASGHFLRTCPVRPSKCVPKFSPNCRVVSAPQSYLTLFVSLQLPGGVTRLPAIIDSGACSNFVDSDLALKLHLPLRLRDHYLQVRLADGSLPRSGLITQQTDPIFSITDSGHQELLQLDLIPSPIFPIIFGLPWLQTHQPHIDWGRKEVNFVSSYCSHNCFTSATTTCSTVTVSSENLQHVPPAYLEFADVFDKKQADRLPPHRPYDCPIDLLPGAAIPFGRIFPLSETELKTLKTYIDENLEKQFIRPSSSPAGAGIFFVEKKDGSLRPCIDYRELNKITVKNRYPLPLIPELFQRFRSAKIFSKLDLRGAYNLIRIRSGDEWKTAFRSRFGHFEYLVMPFGLCNAPATFQHLVNDIFRKHLDDFLVVYLDDILIFSASIDLHREHVKIVLTILRRHKLYLKLEKCEFEKSTVQFLGFIVSTSGVAMDPQKVQAIQDWPAPKDKKGVQRFIGFANFYRRFIVGFSSIVAPITKLTHHGNRFVWSQEAQEAFSKLKSTFTSAPVLCHPDPALPFILEVDASETAVGAILSQRQGPKALLHPVAFASRKLNPPERNYDVGDRELLAIKFALEEWRYLLEGAVHSIVIFTDHKNLEYLRSAKRLRPRQARWALFFTRFNFLISYRPGSKNVKADALSRMFLEDPVTSEPGTILSSHNFLLLPQADLLNSLKAASRDYCNQGTLSLEKRDELLWSQNKIFVPLETRHLVLSTFHDHKLAGHFGARKTAELVSRTFWWPRWRQDCKAYVSACIRCQRNKGPIMKSWGLLKPLPIPERPWSEISMDFIVDVPPSGGFTSIFVVVDRFSKMAHFLPMVGTPSATETAKKFFKEVVRLHGTPRSIVSDRGVQFTSKFWRELCKTLDIKVCLSSAYHPQSNGQTERTNQTLEQYLRCFCSASQDDWYSLLPSAEFAYNNSIHSTTNQTPFWSNFGFHPSFLPNSFPETSVPAVQDLIASIQQNFRRLQETMHQAQEDYKKFFDRRKKESPIFEIGEKVLLSAANLRLHIPSRKLGPRYIGPFKIKRKINDVAFELDLPSSYKIHPVFHVSLLKPVVPESFPDRIEPPPTPVEIEGELEFEVEAILGCRKRGRQLQYLVKWKGYPPEDNSWEPSKNLHAPRIIRTFHQNHPELMSSLGVRSPPLGGGHCQGLRNQLALPRVRAPRTGARMRAVAFQRGSVLRRVRGSARACAGARVRAHTHARPPIRAQPGLFKPAPHSWWLLVCCQLYLSEEISEET